MVLHGILCGRVGRCQEFFSKGPEFSLWAFFFVFSPDFLPHRVGSRHELLMLAEHNGGTLLHDRVQYRAPTP